MKILGFKGDESRGEEIRYILESLGGYNAAGLRFTEERYIYYFKECNFYRRNVIKFDAISDVNLDDFIIYTVDEFKEKYPFKVGDKVLINNDINDVYTVVSMMWDSKINMVRYVLKNIDGVILDDSLWYAYEMKFAHKEENNEERKYTELRLDEDQDDKLATEATIDGSKITPPENYLIGNITQVDNGMLVEFVKKQPKYPKTYEECCGVLGMTYDYPDIRMVSIVESNLYSSFIQLIRCRNAYWRIAGNQMRLKEPWKPDWSDYENIKYSIKCRSGEIFYNQGYHNHKILAFPTKEMRDIFLENFKDLIEKCKEYL